MAPQDNMEAPTRASFWLRWGLLLLAALPVAHIAALIVRESVDVPFLDQLEFIHLLALHERGALAPADFLAQHNDSRYVFPRLIFLALGLTTGWDVRYETMVTLILGCAISINLLVLLRRTFPGSDRIPWVMLVPVNLLLFSPMQWEGWLFGLHMVFFTPVACLTGTFVVAGSSWRPPHKLATCFLLAFVSSFSVLPGFLVWLLMIPPLAAAERDVGDRRRTTLLILGAFLACVAVYARGWTLGRPPGGEEKHAGLLSFFPHFLTVTGNALMVRESLPLQHPFVVPILSALLFLGIYLRLARRAWRQRDAGALPWLCLGAYAIVVCAMIGFGRRGLGPVQALTSRYTSWSLYLPLSLLVLIAREEATKARRTLRLGALALVASAVFLLPYPHQVVLARHFRAFILELKAGMHFMRWLPPEPEIRWIGSRHNQLFWLYEYLDSRGFLRPPMVDSPRLEDIQMVCDRACDHGSIETFEIEADGTVVVSGRARLPERRESAHVVVLAASEAPGTSNAFALARMEAPPDGYPHGSPAWAKRFRRSRIPAGARLLSAWAYDAISGKAHHLDGDRELPSSR